jgi:hypothetical protein
MTDQPPRPAAVGIREQLIAAGPPPPRPVWHPDQFQPRDRVKAGRGWGTVQQPGGEHAVVVLLDVWARQELPAYPIAYRHIDELVAGTFAEASIAYHRDKHACELGVDAGAYLVTAVWRGQYDPLRHGKEPRGVLVDLGTVRRYRQGCWPLACLACDTALPNQTSRAAGGAALARHHETDHPRPMP